VNSQGNRESCLHLLAAAGGEARQACLANCRPGDTLLLLDAGVFQLPGAEGALAGAGVDRVCFLAADLRAHGLESVAAGAGFEVVDDTEFPELLRRHPHCVTWT
jgi:sulfur relay protein TusB/DsrH